MNGEVNGETLPKPPKEESALTDGGTKKEHVIINETPTKPTTNGDLDKGQRASKIEIHSESNGIKKCPVTNVISKPQQPKYVRLQNLVDGSYTTDTLHQKSIIPLNCTSGRCLGSLMLPYGGDTPPKRPHGVPREPEEVIVQAKDFLQQYYGAMKLEDSPAHQQRLAEVMKEIEKNGTYDLTEKELIYGCKMAWRNASRCIGRIQWNKLQVFDARRMNTPSQMYEAIVKHIKYGTNKGNLRSTITVFPQRRPGHKDFRVWNTQLIRYAGYKQANGSCIGDPSNIEFTEICETMGWKGKGGRFDVLPLVLQANGGDPEMFDIPPEIILEVQMKHPK
ncbi:hypothetical protein OS493_004185 [Desmophyllum pertusum]|uniref:nitric-oxide synthase (NADPH) n=1 Tax=Desmophyllum pertusum TaxID=174260 RepID=A0A9W9ZTI8_9CNID|nr:hypothetical protein OS493_004185 [Desmophyllum pertusum]